MSETRIRADILFEAVDLPKPQFDELKRRIMEIADEYKAAVTINGRMYPDDGGVIVADINSGPGWYEVIHPRNATTCIVGVYEDGSLYLPEGDDLTAEEFAFAAARGNAHRLVRADDPDPQR